MKHLAAAFLTLHVLACSLATPEGEVGVYLAPDATGGSPATPVRELPFVILAMLLRDFKRYDALDPTTNPAFGNGNSEMSVVAPVLGEDGKPVYRMHDSSYPMYGEEPFQQWFRDVPGTNYPVVYPLPLLLAADGTFEYDSQKSGAPELYMGMDRRVFFPFDDGTSYATPFGNQGDTHNKLFTAELHAQFTLEGTGGSLQVRGDDDVYVFIDGQLVVDLGGTHPAQGKKVSLDALGLSAGEHTLDLFYAERLGATADLLIKTDLRLRSRLD